MLGKIIKQEFKGTWKFFAVSFSAFTLAVIALRLTIEPYMSNINSPGILGTVFFIIMLLAFIVITALFSFTPTLVNVIRFYKTTVTTRGYLTHTLPVPTDKLILGKLIVASLWQLLTTLYAVAAFVILFFSLNIFDPYLIGYDLTNVIGHIITADSKTFATVILLIVSSFITMVSAVLKFYCAMSIGQSFNKNKVLFSILAYLGIHIIYSIVGTCFGVSTTITLQLNTFTPQMMEILINILKAFFMPAIKLIVIDLAFAAAYYILTRHFLKNKLNLS